MRAGGPRSRRRPTPRLVPSRPRARDRRVPCCMEQITPIENKRVFGPRFNTIHMIEAACEPRERGPLARIPGEPRLAARKRASGPRSRRGPTPRRVPSRPWAGDRPVPCSRWTSLTLAQAHCDLYCRGFRASRSVLVGLREDAPVRVARQGFAWRRSRLEVRLTASLCHPPAEESRGSVTQLSTKTPRKDPRRALGA